MTEPSGFQTELRALRDQVLAAIDGAVLGDVEDGLELYGRLLQSVLDLRNRYAEAAQIEPPPTWFNEHGREAEWLETDLRAFVDRAWNVGNDDVLREIAVRLVRFLQALRRADQPGAHRRVLGLTSRYYFRSLAQTGTTSSRLGRSMLNAVRSYGEYQVLSDFRNHSVGQVAYVEQVVVFLVEAVHLALDQQPGQAPGAAIELRELLDGINLHARGSEPSEAPPERAALLNVAAGYVVGLMGYLLMVRDRGLVTDGEARATITELQKATGEVSAWAGARTALGDERLHRFPWSHWEMQHWPDGVHGGTIGLLEDWIRIAAVSELNRRGELRGVRSALTDLRPWDAAHTVKRLREALRNRPADWLPQVVPGWPGEQQLAQIEAQLAAAESDFERLEARARAELPIERGKVEAFVQAVEGEWLKNAALRGSLTSVEPSEAAPTSWFGFNSLQSRDFFTTSPNVHAPPTELGKSIGRGLVDGEMSRAVDVLEHLPRSESTLDQLKHIVDGRIDELSARGGRPRILVVGEWRAAHALLGDYSFGVEQAGSYRNVPLQLVYVDSEPTCFVFDLEQTLDVRRWPAIKSDPGDITAAGGMLLVNVRDIDDTYAAQLLENNPALGSPPGGERQTEEDAVERLRQFVHIRVWTKLAIDLKPQPAGYAIRLLDDDPR